MYRIITSFFVTLFLFTTPALAEKPEWAGKGKPTAEQKDIHRATMETKGNLEDSDKSKKKSDKSSKSEKSEKSKSEKDSDKSKKKSDKSSKSEKSEKSKSEKDSEEKVKGLEKQKLKKTDQQMKELDKGSDQGQESRDNRKKWWRFWD